MKHSYVPVHMRQTMGLYRNRYTYLLFPIATHKHTSSLIWDNAYRYQILPEVLSKHDHLALNNLVQVLWPLFIDQLRGSESWTSLPRTKELSNWGLGFPARCHWPSLPCAACTAAPSSAVNSVCTQTSLPRFLLRFVTSFERHNTNQVTPGALIITTDDFLSQLTLKNNQAQSASRQGSSVLSQLTLTNLPESILEQLSTP